MNQDGGEPEGRQARILAALAEAVDQMDEEGALRLAHEALEAGIDAYVAITEGLAKGMEVVSDKYERGIYFVPEILLCADAMYAAIEVLSPHLEAEGGAGRMPVIIGVIEGDIHDIGKNIVKLMLEAAGFQLHDLGNDVAVERFIDRARELGRGVIAVSTLMSTTMPGMERLVAGLEEAGLRDSFKVMIGGGPVSEAFAGRIGADAYGHNAMEAVRIATQWEEAANG
ncbi:MAG: corrinoid protein [Planctomycetota bacterium]|jgi:corrinoid protein of di/trimethylamine methyltransferase